MVISYILLVFVFLLLAALLWLYLKNELSKSQSKLVETFKASSFDVMEKNNKSFIDLAKTVLEKYSNETKSDFDSKQKHLQAVIDPLKESLNKIDNHQREIEKQRHSSYVSLNKQIDSLIVSENLLRSETANLTKALKSPNIRGSWGQIHLRRVVELAGLANHCDFFEQASVSDGEKTYRPDLIIKLPGERQIIIDAKTPIDAYLQAAESTDLRVKEQKRKEHANGIKKHMQLLSNKEYWTQFPVTPEYVILFLPAEAFFSAALQEEPTLLEIGAKKNIIIATPTTLIAILKAIAFGWKQDSLSKSSKEIAKLGKELYERIYIMSNYLQKLGKTLSSSVDSYNQTVSSLESRILVSARKLKDLGVAPTNKEIPNLDEVNKTTRFLSVD
jgi:DNA recombination protein RmuC